LSWYISNDNFLLDL